MDELIFIERTTHKIIVEQLMLGDTLEDFPNLFTYFYINTNQSRYLDMYIWNKNSNIIENDMTDTDKYIIVMKYNNGRIDYTSILRKKYIEQYIKIILKGIKKKRIKEYRIYSLKDAMCTRELVAKYSERVNISVREVNGINE